MTEPIDNPDILEIEGLHHLMDMAAVLNGDWPGLAEWQHRATHQPLPSMMSDGRWKHG